MKLVSVKKVARAALLVCTVTFATSCESDAAAKPSLIPPLVELKPAIFCIDAALDKSGVLGCLNRQGVASDYRFPDQPNSAEDFQRQALVMWAGLGRGGTAHLSSEQFDAVIDYTSCIEKATNALQGLEGKPKTAIGAGQAKADLACADQTLSVRSVAKRHPGILNGEIREQAAGELKAYMLARIFAGVAYHYIIEANGWVTDEMRPCIRYLDGRPPSAGCAGELELRGIAPPITLPPE